MMSIPSNVRDERLHAAQRANKNRPARVWPLQRYPTARDLAGAVFPVSEAVIDRRGALARLARRRPCPATGGFEGH